MTEEQTIDQPEVVNDGGGNPSPEPPMRKLWQGLNNLKLYTNGFEDFKKDYSTEDAINNLHKGLSDLKLFTDSKDDFYQNYFPETYEKIKTPDFEGIRSLKQSIQKPEGAYISQPSTGMAGGGGSVYLEPTKEEMDKYNTQQADYSSRIKKVADRWGTTPDEADRVVNDFPVVKDEGSLQRMVGLLKDNPYRYDRFVLDTGILNAVGKNNPQDQALFNTLQHNTPETLEQNISTKQQLIDKNITDAVENRKAHDNLRETNDLFFEANDRKILSDYEKSEEKNIYGLSKYQYAGLMTEKAFNPEKYYNYMQLLKLHSSPGFDKDAENNNFDFQRGYEHMQFDLEQTGRRNTQKWITENLTGAAKSIPDLVKQYNEKIQSATTKEERQRLINEFNNLPIVSQVIRLEDQQGDLDYEKTKDTQRFPITSTQAAERVIADALDEPTLGTGVGGYTVRAAANIGKELESTLRFIGNGFINLLGSGETKAKAYAENIGHEKNSEQLLYQPQSYTGTEAPFLIGKPLADGVQKIFNDGSITEAEATKQAIQLIKDSPDQITLNPDAGKHNWTGKAMFNASLDTLSSIVGLAMQTAITGGGSLELQAATKWGKVGNLAKQFVPMYASMQNEFYQKALANGESNPYLSASVESAIVSAAGLINPPAKVLRGMLSSKPVIGKVIAGMTDDAIDKVISENRDWVNMAGGFLKGAGKQLGLANLQYGLLAPTAQFGFERYGLGQDVNLRDKLKDAFTTTNITMALPALLHGVQGIKSAMVTRDQKNSIFEAAIRPEYTNSVVDGLVGKGEITAERGNQIKQVIKQAQDIMSTTDFRKSDATPMDETEQQDLLYSLLRKKALEGALKKGAEPNRQAIEKEINENNADISDQHTPTAEKHKTDLNNLLLQNIDKITEKAPIYKTAIEEAIKRNTPEQLFKDIYEQATQTTKVDGKEVSSRQSTEDIFGKELVDKAFELNEKPKTRVSYAGVTNVKEKPVETNIMEARHADTPPDEEGKVSGPVDVSLSKEGKKDANSLAEELKGKGIHTIITSGLKRAVDTAKIAAEKIGAKLVSNKDFDSWNIGEFDGTTDEGFKRVQKYFVEHPDETEFDGKKIGESFNQYKNRVIKAREALEQEPPGTFLVNHSNNMMLWDAYVKNGHQWNEQAAKDYINGEKPEAATLHMPKHKLNQDQLNNVQIYRNSASRLREGGDEEGAKQLEEHANNLEQKLKKNAIQEPATTQMGAHGSGDKSLGGDAESAGMGQGKQGDEAPPESKGKEDDLPFIDEKGDEGIIGVRNSVTNQKIKEFGLNPTVKDARRSFGEVWDRAMDKFKKGLVDPLQLINKLKKNKRPISDYENALLTIHLISREADLDAVNRQIKEAGENADRIQLEEARIARAGIKDELQGIYQLYRDIGTETARGLSARQMLANKKYSLVSMEMGAVAAQDGAPLTESQQAEIQRKYEDIKTKSDAYEKKMAEINAENERIKAENKKLSAQLELEKSTKKQKTGKSKKTAEQYAKERDDILEQMRKDLLKSAKGGEGLTASIPFAAQMKAIAPHVLKLAKSFTEQGIDKVQDVAKQIKDILSPHIPEITEEHIYDILSGKYDEKKESEKKEGLPSLKQQAKGMKFAFRDPEVLKLKADHERAMQAWDDYIRKQEEAENPISKFDKVRGVFVKWERGFKLSNPITMGKLFAAAVTRLAIAMPDEALGGAYSEGFKKIGKLAEGEGGFYTKGLGKAYARTFTQGMKDAYDSVNFKSKGGKSDLEYVFGKKGDLPPEAIDFFAHLHSATKAPVKRFVFEKQLAKRFAKNIDNQVDVSDPLVQVRIAHEAYQDALRSIFMQDNAVSKGWHSAINMLEKSSKPEYKALASAGQFLIPFIKVPTNILTESVQTTPIGLAVSIGKIIHHAIKGTTEQMSSAEADSIMRGLKKGTMGTGLVALGYMNPKMFGGYYQEGERRGHGDVKFGAIKIGDTSIPAWLLESPVFQAMQLGATIRRVADMHPQPHSNDKNGVLLGAMIGVIDLSEHEPLIAQPHRLGKIFGKQEERNKAVGELAKSFTNISGLDYIAKVTDPADKRGWMDKFFDPENKRDENDKYNIYNSIKKHVMSGIPGLREKLPKYGDYKKSGGRP
jgi:broad specificity phosphatase PhoE